MRQEHVELELSRNEVGRVINENGLLMGNNLGDMTIQELHQLEKQLNDGLISVKKMKDAMLFNEIECSSRKVRELNYENEFLQGEIKKLKQFLSITQHKEDICTKTSADESARFAMGKEEDLTPVLDDQEFLLQGTHGINETFSRNFQEMDYSAEDSLGYPMVTTQKRRRCCQRGKQIQLPNSFGYGQRRESVFERIGEHVMAGKGKEQVGKRVENQAFVRGTEYGKSVNDTLNKVVSDTENQSMGEVIFPNEALQRISPGIGGTPKVEYEVKKDGRKQSNNTAGNVFTCNSFHVLNDEDIVNEVDSVIGGTGSYMAVNKEDKDVVPNLAVMTEAVKEVMWLEGILTEMGIDIRKTVVNCDNQSALLLSMHNNVKLQFKKEVVESKFVTVCKVDTENAADMLTKCLIMEKLQKCLELVLGIVVKSDELVKQVGDYKEVKEPSSKWLDEL
uniref:uncharacterized protein LOC122582741 isoform X2 n=1 Tax=Erigeron canadensis TaxID=72917 RepID=UPI001CB95D2E|nr:uncharacterized protein LOC122582741 isoform X2 [Erigeron canadensis]